MDLINDVIERQEKMENMRDGQEKRVDVRRLKNKNFDIFECESLDPRLSGSSSSSNGGLEEINAIAFRKQPGRSVARPGTESDEATTTPSSEVNKEGSGQDSSSGYGDDDTKQNKKSKSSSDKESMKDSSPKSTRQVKIKIIGLESWQLTYVRTRNNSLRCFPACRPVHRERSFCGLPISVVIDASSETEARQMVVLGAFRKVKTDVIQINDKFSTVELTRMLGTDFIIGTLVSYDKKAKQAKFKLGPPRKWRYVANTLSSTELHTFTVYAFTQAGGRCIARQDSPFFTIVPAWRQSATEITARRSDSDSKSTSDTKPLAHPKEFGSPVGRVVPPFHPHLPAYPIFRPQPFDPYSHADESWAPRDMEAVAGQKKKRRMQSPHFKPSSNGYIPPTPGYYGAQPPIQMRSPPHSRSFPTHGPSVLPDTTATAMTRYPWPVEDISPSDYNNYDPRWAPPPYLPPYNPFYGWGRPMAGEGVSGNSESSSGDDAVSTGSSKSSDIEKNKVKKRKALWPRQMMPPQNLALDSPYHGQPPPYVAGHYYPPMGPHPFPPSYPPMQYPPSEFSKRN